MNRFYVSQEVTDWYDSIMLKCGVSSYNISISIDKESYTSVSDEMVIRVYYSPVFSTCAHNNADKDIPLDMVLYTIEVFLARHKYDYVRVGDYTTHMGWDPNRTRSRQMRLLRSSLLEAHIGSDAFTTMNSL